MSLSYSLHATVFFLVAFIIVLPLQLSFGLQRKTYAFLSLSSAGAALEIVAYAARLRLYYGKSQYAALYLLAITAAPIFLTLGTYTFDCFPRVVRVYGGRWTRTHSLILVLSEVVAMILQVAGSIVAGLQNLAHLQLGVRVIQVGLAAHMLTMATFMLLAAVIAFKTYKAPGHPAKEYESLRRSLLFKAFIATLLASKLTLLIRTTYRISDPSAGLDGNGNESEFLVLDGTMVFAAFMGLTMFHPGVVFRHYGGKGSGENLSWK